MLHSLFYRISGLLVPERSGGDSRETDMHQKINWTDSYKIGIDEIDLQHEYFVLMINRLMDELHDSGNRAYRQRLLEELSLYAAFHFTSEENLMIKFGFPGFDDHRDRHRRLLSRLNERMNYYILSRETEGAVVDFLVEWFVKHTLDRDSLFGAFINHGGGMKK